MIYFWGYIRNVDILRASYLVCGHFRTGWCGKCYRVFSYCTLESSQIQYHGPLINELSIWFVVFINILYINHWLLNLKSNSLLESQPYCEWRTAQWRAMLKVAYVELKCLYEHWVSDWVCDDENLWFIL
jgi:hypothetical protein